MFVKCIDDKGTSGKLKTGEVCEVATLGGMDCYVMLDAPYRRCVFNKDRFEIVEKEGEK